MILGYITTAISPELKEKSYQYFLLILMIKTKDDKMNLLISIKPEFVNKLIANEKLYEFRKSIFKQNVDKVFIYSTYPVKKIIGYFEVGEIIHESPQELWNSFSKVSGISKKDFFKYYANSNKGFAIRIDNLHVFDEFIDMNKYDNFKAPQSFCYVENNDFLKELLLTHI